MTNRHFTPDYVTLQERSQTAGERLFWHRLCASCLGCRSGFRRVDSHVEIGGQLCDGVIDLANGERLLFGFEPTESIIDECPNDWKLRAAVVDFDLLASCDADQVIRIPEAMLQHERAVFAVLGCWFPAFKVKSDGSSCGSDEFDRWVADIAKQIQDEGRTDNGCGSVAQWISSQRGVVSVWEVFDLLARIREVDEYYYNVAVLPITRRNRSNMGIIKKKGVE